MSRASKVERVSGRAVAVHGNDIDTDRIIPARYLKTITFEGLEKHLFEDDRRQESERGHTHPLDVPEHQGAAIMFAGGNFGCGSSREHAPQAIARWGIRAVVGESFGEIFAGNSLIMGLPCVTVASADLERLMAAVDANPTAEFTVDLVARRLTGPDVDVALTMPEPMRSALISGNWDATGLLLDRYEDVERTVARIPYLSGWGASARA